jgi:molybdate transport system permease protein
LGAGAWDRFLTITLPLAAPGVLVAAITGFAAALGEFGAVITFAANIPGQTQTLPLAIFSALQSPGGEAVAGRLSLVSVALAVVFLVLADRLGRRLRARVGR